MTTPPKRPPRLSWGPLVREAAREILRHKSRSLLSAVGIMVGVAAVVLVVAIGRRGSALAEEEFHKLGDNLVWVEAGSRTNNGVRSGSKGMTNLTVEDANAIRDEIALIKAVSPQVDGTVHLGYGNKNWTTRYRGVAPEYMDIKAWKFTHGASFTQEELATAANVLVIGEDTRAQLFGGATGVGETVRVEKDLFVVVGVLAPKGQSGFGQSQDDIIMIPYTTAQRRLRGKGFAYLDDILCSATAPGAVDGAVQRISSLLRQRHNLQAGQPDDFNIRRPDEVLKAQIETAKTFSLLLLSIATISLLVGGIGVMNVMLASVTERTREIGLRLAIGATAGAVQVQFLAEGMLLSVFGGVCGIGLSLVSASGVAKILGWPIAIPLPALLLALAFSFAVGVVFAYYPARRAAGMDPIAALRHE